MARRRKRIEKQVSHTVSSSFQVPSSRCEDEVIGQARGFGRQLTPQPQPPVQVNFFAPGSPQNSFSTRAPRWQTPQLSQVFAQ